MADNFFSLALLAVLLLLQHRLWVGEGSVAHVHNLQTEIAQHEQQLAELRARNQRLKLEVASLKSDPAAIELRARQELGMIKRGETFYVFVEQD